MLSSVIREELLRIGEYPVQGQMLLDRVRDVFAESKLPMLKTGRCSSYACPTVEASYDRSSDRHCRGYSSTTDDVCLHLTSSI